MPRTSTVAVTAIVGLLLAGGIFAAGWIDRDQTTAVPVASASPASAPTWDPAGIDARLHAGQGPEFPTALTGWRLADQWDDTVRAFGTWTSLCGDDVCNPRYPATMNGCANQRFLLRWRTNSGAAVDFGQGTVAADIGTLAEGQLPAPAAAGWAELHGCGWPLWKVQEENSLADITVALQRWEPAA